MSGKRVRPRENWWVRNVPLGLRCLVYATLITWGLILSSFCAIQLFGAPQETPTPTQTPTATPEPLVVIRWATEQEQAEHNRETVEAVAKTVWGEAQGCTTTEQAAVVWCVLNRVDSPDFPDDPLSVVAQQGQFSGYSPDYPVDPELVALVEDVMARWTLEKSAVGSVGRVLPREYVFFVGDGLHNHFRESYEQTGETWDWGLPSPYKE